MIAPVNRLLDRGATRWVSTSDAPALSPNIVILDGSPPNAFMLRCTYSVMYAGRGGNGDVKVAIAGYVKDQPSVLACYTYLRSWSTFEETD